VNFQQPLGAEYYHGVTLQRTFTTTSIDKVAFVYDLTLGSAIDGEGIGVRLVSLPGTLVLDVRMSALVNGSNQIAETPDELNITSAYLYVVFVTSYSHTGFSGGAAVITISGHGPNPFLTHECCECQSNYAGIDCDEF
jgi:hypothetical protein